MSDKVLARAFEPFFTTKEVGSGSGLGLSQVYGFAKQSGGFVQLASEPGVGTTVQLFLPHSVEQVIAERQAAAMPVTHPGGPSEVILVVEDDPDVRMIVAENVRALGFGVLSAEDGKSALALLERGERVDLLFSDISMPNGMLGHELADRARALCGGIRVLLTSGYSYAPGNGAAASQTPVLRKPYTQEQLSEALRDALKGKANSELRFGPRLDSGGLEQPEGASRVFEPKPPPSESVIR
jgi:CheY-like chemotaxis protein